MLAEVDEQGHEVLREVDVFHALALQDLQDLNRHRRTAPVVLELEDCVASGGRGQALVRHGFRRLGNGLTADATLAKGRRRTTSRCPPC